MLSHCSYSVFLQFSDTMLNDFADFPESGRDQPMTHNTMSRRYSSQRSLYDEDPLPGPMPDDMYR